MKKIEEIISEVLIDYGFDDKYIKYSSYKYKLFSDCLCSGDDYISICDGMNVNFEKKEEEALFKILVRKGYKIKPFNNFYITRVK